MIVIVDYGLGNTASVIRAFRKLQVDAVLSDDAMVISKASHIILPGVGHFAHGMNQLESRKLIEPLNEAILEKKKPVLGICLGMQLMTHHSEEGDVNGLGWIDADTVKIDTQLKVPHVGWNSLNLIRQDSLLQGVRPEQLFYFVHSYCVQCKNPEDILATSQYDKTFVSVFRKNNIAGMQFHPEKSHQQGFRLLQNFIHL